MSGYIIKADTEKNRLYISLNGFFSSDLVKEAAEICIREVKKLKPGFDVINDISQFRPTTNSGVETLKTVQALIQKSGVNRVIRIVGNAYLASAQMSRKTDEYNYVSEMADSVTEAEKMLDESS